MEPTSLEDLSLRSGQPPARLEEWRDAALIGSSSGEFNELDVARARLIALCVARDIPIARIVQAEREDNRFLDQYAALVFPGAHEPHYSLEEAASMAGVEPRLVERIRDASQAWDPEEAFGREEIELLRGTSLLLAAGVPEEAIIQGIRVTADALARVAENEGQLFHHYVHERLRAAGLSGLELAKATRTATEQSMPLLDPTILYFHRRGLARTSRDDMLLHLEEELPEPTAVPAQLRACIVFTDLSSFTPLAETMGDEMAARVLDRFGHIVRDSTKRHDGRVIKQIGDAFMMVFPTPRPAVDCALDVERSSQAEPQFPAVRSGVHYGDVLYRDGDYVGTVVNIASRLLNEARPHEVLVTAVVRDLARGADRVTYVPAGSRQLKGITDPLELFAVTTAVVSPTKLKDPVCGMELAPAEVAARLSLDRHERSFCSEECLRRFVASPDRYEQHETALGADTPL